MSDPTHCHVDLWSTITLAFSPTAVYLHSTPSYLNPSGYQPRGFGKSLVRTADEMDHRYAIGIGICAMLSVFSSALVALRFLLRYITRSIKWDDWCCLMALTFAYGNFVATIVSATFGRAGQHIAMYDNKSLVRFYNVRHVTAPLLLIRLGMLFKFPSSLAALKWVSDFEIHE